MTYRLIGQTDHHWSRLCRSLAFRKWQKIIEIIAVQLVLRKRLTSHQLKFTFWTSQFDFAIWDICNELTIVSSFYRGHNIFYCFAHSSFCKQINPKIIIFDRCVQSIWFYFSLLLGWTFCGIVHIPKLICVATCD